ncbi:kinesin-like protein KIN-1 isoform X2 [Magnolia sinica]|uniref:kinesin-like protein KIN-1 isoform X2 n=1 Tax=Magnolia sinica TaxID=86752 RepID=UPI002659D0D4|nr:kinesin-like protein KIN-1 isoform X2 [Magnolia sinica]
MTSVTVCARFRPLSSREKRDHGDSVCIRSLDNESFVFKDVKEGDLMFCFDRVFYQHSSQDDVYQFLALPIVRDAINAINGTIITYGQTGAGKTYSMEGPSMSESDGQKKGILPRVVNGLFDCIKSANDGSKYIVKLSMAEIYMEKVRDLFDLSKDNLQIKEGKTRGIFLSGATEVGVANRAVGETQMNMASSRSHCVYIFSVLQESTNDGRVKTGKLVLVDLAGSEKVEKTCAEGRVLEEAKTINKSLSALGNVINALTNGKMNHIPYRDSKLTRILQDALGGNSRTAVLCCCSPSSLNASESLSTLRFGARAKHVRTSPRVSSNEDKGEVKLVTHCQTKKSESRDRLLDQVCKEMARYCPHCRMQLGIYISLEPFTCELRASLNIEEVKLLEELFVMEGIIFDPCMAEDFESAYEDVTSRTISALHQTVEELLTTIETLKKENLDLKVKVAASEKFHSYFNAAESFCYSATILGFLWFFSSWIWSIFGPDATRKRLL